MNVLSSIASSAAPTNISNALLSRLCMILCAVSIRSPIGGAASLVEQILTFGESGEINGIRVCLEVLKSFTEEIDNGDLSRVNKIELCNELVQERVRVMNLLQLILSSSCEKIVELQREDVNQRDFENIKARGKLALETLKNWINLSPSIGLGQFNETQHELLSHLFQLNSGAFGPDLAIYSAQVLEALIEVSF